jgi:translation initiation factor 1
MNGIVFSTNSNFKFHDSETPDIRTLAPEKQRLKIELDRRKKGKIATIIYNFIGTDADLQLLAKMLKTRCGTGGSARSNEILLQGDFVAKAKEILKAEGYRV